MNLLSPCPVKGCTGRVVELAYLGLDQLKRHTAKGVCSFRHAFQFWIAVLPGEEVHQYVAIPRSDSFPPPKGSWFFTPDRSAMLACPGCGNLAGVNEPVHIISPNGRVENTSWTCPLACGWHQYIELSSWETVKS